MESIRIVFCMGLKIAIVGGPRTGKTTFVKQALEPKGYFLYHTDDTMHLDWSEGSHEVSTWFDDAGPMVVEGVSTARALRKWLARNPTGKPCDIVLIFEAEYEKLTPGQESMRKGVITVFNEIRNQLEARGVTIAMGNSTEDLS